MARIVNYIHRSPIWAKFVFLTVVGGLLLLDTASVQSSVNGLLGRLTPGGNAASADFTPAVGKDKDYVALNRKIESLKTDFPKDLIKAIAWCESEWSQRDERTGKPFVTTNYHRRPGGTRISRDWGIMQINERMESLDSGIWDLNRIKTDPDYNLRAGVAVLESKRQYVRYLRRQPHWSQLEDRYHLKGHDELDITLKAYNGFQPSWSYLRRVKTALATRPWDQAMKIQLMESTLGKMPETVIQYVGDDVWESPLPGRLCAATHPVPLYQIEANVPAE